MIALPNFRREQTGNAVLDRVQDVLRDAIDAIRALALETPQTVSLMLRAHWTTTLAYAQSTPLRVAVKKGESWDIEFTGYGSCSSVNGMKYALLCPVDSVLSGELISSTSNSLVANWTTETLSASTLSSATHVGANDNGRPDRINARVTAGADGFVTLQACATTGGTTATVYAQSYFRATKATTL